MSTLPACPRCGYDQSGAVAAWERIEPASCPLEGVCPECGLRFEWADVMRPRRRLPRWSYEHAATWPALKLPATGIRAIVAPWLWGRLRLEHPVVPERLRRLALSWLLAAHLSVALFAGWAAEAVARRSPSLIPDTTPKPLAYLLTPYRRAPLWWAGEAFVQEWFYLGCVAVLVAPLTFLLLPGTLARMHLRREHVWRGAAHSVAGVFLLAVVFMGLRAFSSWREMIFVTWFSGRARGPLDPLLDRCYRAALWTESTMPWLPAVVAIVWLWLFWYSFSRFYLRLRRPMWTTSLLIAMAGLLAIAVVGFWPGSDLFARLGTAAFGLQP